MKQQPCHALTTLEQGLGVYCKGIALPYTGAALLHSDSASFSPKQHSLIDINRWLIREHTQLSRASTPAISTLWLSQRYHPTMRFHPRLHLPRLFVCSWTLVILIAASSEGKRLKVLVSNPTNGWSHMQFHGRLADLLTEAGHEVVGSFYTHYLLKSELVNSARADPGIQP